MLPIGSTTPASQLYPVSTSQDESGDWIVAVGPQTFAFGQDGAAAQAFATAAANTAGLVEWVTRAKALLRRMEDLLAEAGTLRVLYEDNGLYELLLATPPTALMPGVGLSLARVLGIGCLFQDLTAFLADDAVGVPPAPIPLGVRRRVITLRD
ncbi:hypothetical protein K2Z83_13415 [Oscillochloris sp. ZM17-4]|uniref:hypothetical protein n=1 Tax=Oscillochloris sp. ZM17-4 TaxID=2866714 RepID=UPI001C73BBDD|nr:hypothetical protein [Oscillochloris sp. ZM17-4]MBX0328675.1 hypothetical protein [Oscillochloris sp. ZM17-4]